MERATGQADFYAGDLEGSWTRPKPKGGQDVNFHYASVPVFTEEQIEKLVASLFERFQMPSTETGRFSAEDENISNVPQSEEEENVGSVYGTAYRVQEKVLGELSRQHEKWGVQYHIPEYWYAIVAEEQGETAKAMLEQDWDEAIKEGIETIACIVQMIHEFERRKYGGVTDERYTSANTLPS
jgi:hypothetical protein